MRGIAIAGRGPTRSHGGRPAVAALLAAVLPLAVASCGGDDGPTEPNPGPSPAPSAGSLEVTTATTGPEPDPDGYTLTVDDGDGRTIGTDDTLLVEDLEAADHAVELSNLADNCSVEGDNPRDVTVAAADTTTSDFAVSCAGTSALEITTSTVAAGLDGDGFRVAVDGGEERTIGTEDTETIAGLAAGDHTVELSGLATGCFVDGDNPRDVTAPADDTSTVAIDVTCGLRDRIAFSSDRDGQFDIWVMRTDGSDPVPLFGRDGSDRSPAVSPDGSLVAFASERSPDADRYDVWVIEADGTNATNLTPGQGRSNNDPVFSPDGTRIAFQANRDGDHEIYVMETDGSSQGPLTAHDSTDVDPAWSPNGSRIAFVSDRTGDREIHFMEADGSNPTRFTDNQASEFNLTWSPDGSRIAFRSHADGDSEIQVACANGSRPPEGIISDAAAPAWSPAGSRIAFSASGGGLMSDVWVMGTDGSNRTNLTASETNDTDPAWSPPSGSGPIPGPSQECQVAAP